ncbi:MAG: hypothetical protein JO182_09060 [Acidobacteriaceae bacterium]|nr:hypothetical protein [Acidobacteriaceae bacterium]MBV9307819.1 hypothetical protein [Acidobacteriaceae bacterium]MBV9679628.1 hypothetical protein [Acidobacteriaceae bacterium]MBV9939369.1 hypothetical protein [Acidobacteriaceae bacterium]
MTELLIANGQGDRQAFDRLLPLIYDELKRLAGSHLGGRNIRTPCRARR